VLKNDRYNLEHSFRDGKHSLASVLVALNLLAFAFHTVCDITDQLWRARASGRDTTSSPSWRASRSS
jgi:hypothetical protein